MATALPVIDFGPFLNPQSSAVERKNVAWQLDKACREVGFFYLKNHHVPSSLISSLLQQTREFFETTTPEQKELLAIKGLTDGGDNARGWSKVINAEKGSHEVSFGKDG
jgi:isopenicillin N synthase-like dioxygenase